VAAPTVPLTTTCSQSNPHVQVSSPLYSSDSTLLIVLTPLPLLYTHTAHGHTSLSSLHHSKSTTPLSD
jgi:hypothetical protein